MCLCSVRLILRGCLLKGRKRKAVLIDGLDPGKIIQIAAKTPRVIDLRHQTDIGQGGPIAKAKTALGPVEVFFKGHEPLLDPVLDPGEAGLFVLIQGLLEIRDDPKVI